ncbi:DUF1453 domain-containing protein [Goodfellowiella coeruleoviolacea]|uniref:DUF1453 domain-containing protein n=1 Tax=Goodfellowiella coeruleoviolacea TaxID=334858 RepID=A0AAE3GL51_9PSEU|nr:DUF1453 domain-containing protein [Goodfellowiella coeruleoviolacea]MCP2169299.1 hypothetical protein [Goodfellowiella coeruleoviolacea]
MSGFPLVLVVVVLVVGVVVKRFIGEPLNARDLFGAPVILTGLGVYDLVNEVRPAGGDLAWIVAAALVGLVLGGLRGLTPRLFTKRGHLWQRYTGWTLLVWAGSVAANAGVSALVVAAGVPAEARPTTLAIGVSLLGEALVLGLRGVATGTPFAPDTRPRPGQPEPGPPRPEQHQHGTA